MRSHRRTTSPARPAAPPGPPAASSGRSRAPYFVLAIAAVLVAAGGWYWASERARGGERLAILQAARDRHPDAPPRLLAYLAARPDDAEVLEALVEWHLTAKSPFAEVEPHLDRLCALRPDSSDALQARARLRLREGRPDDALADALRAADAAPDNLDARSLAGAAAAEAGRHDVAVREFTRVLESSPVPRRETAAALARSLLQAGDPAKAGEVLDRYFPPGGGDAEGLLLRGRVHQAAGRHEAAIAAFRAAADASTARREAALYHLAEAQRALGRDADAARTRDELDRLKARERVAVDAHQQPDNMPAQIRAAEQFLADGNAAAAAALLEQAILRLGKSPAAGKVLARAYRAIGRADLAAEWERFAGGP
jgi:tetratricopeptide (TPR) repeat protein